MANIIEVIIKASGQAQVKSALQQVNAGLGSLNRIAGMVGLGIGVAEMVRFTSESIELGRAQSGARNALISTLGSVQAYDAAIAKARLTTRGMVDETQLAVGINSILNMHLANNADEAAKLAMAGATLERVYAASGATMEKYFRLLAGGSPILFDNFGLTIEMVNARKAEIQAATGASDAEAKVAAIRELTLEVAGRYNQSLSESSVAHQRATATLNDFKASLGQDFIPTVRTAETALADFLQGWMDLGQARASEAASILQASNSYDEYAAAMTRAGRINEIVAEDQFNLALASRESASELTLLRTRVASYQSSLGGVTKESALATLQTRNLADAWRMSAYAALEAENSYAKAVNSIRDISGEMNLGAQALAYQMGQMGQVGGGLESTAKQQVDEHNQMLKQGQDDAASNWQSSMDDAANRIKGAIESVLKPTLSEVWTPPEGNEGRIDEWARRLATMASGDLNSQWRDALVAQFGGQDFFQPVLEALQGGDSGALGQAVTNLLAGPGVTQLWDKELIKQKVREQLQAENMRQELLNTIMAELSGEGIDVGAGAVQAAMGGPGAIAGQLAGGLSTGLPAAIGESGTGATLIAAITANVKGNEKDMLALTAAFAARFNTYLPGAMGTSAAAFLEALATQVASRLGIGATGIRP